MVYWWVSQNQTYGYERQGNYLWAPKVDKGGNTPHHWRSMQDVRSGDIIFSFVNQSIQAVSVAQNSAIESSMPSEFSDQAPWKQEGFKINVTYEDVDPPLPVPPIAPKLQQLLPDRYSPLSRTGKGNQGYLFSLSDRAGSFLLSEIGETDPASQTLAQGERLALSAIERSTLERTEKEALTKSRIGQGQFREDLMRLWGARCAITEVSVPLLLRASHIKPWRSCNNHERLDPYNGLLLSVQYDAAFDAGFISFDGRGAMLSSPIIEKAELSRVGIDLSAKLRWVDIDHIRYLSFHRENILRI